MKKCLLFHAKMGMRYLLEENGGVLGDSVG